MRPARAGPSILSTACGAGVARLVEQVPSDVLYPGSEVPRKGWRAGVAQLVEHVTRNDGVTGSIPVTSSI